MYSHQSTYHGSEIIPDEELDINGAPMNPAKVRKREASLSKREFREFIANHDADFCIPPRKDNSDPWYVDWWLYKERHLVETFFLKLKEFLRVATRFDKLASRFLTFVHLACIRILLA